MSEIKPALTAQEWASLGPNGVGHPPMPSTLADVDYLDARDKQKAAAIALYGQPFGFTREDVELLRVAAVVLKTDEAAFDVDNERYAATCRSLSDRIESLLPPEF